MLAVGFGPVSISMASRVMSSPGKWHTGGRRRESQGEGVVDGERRVVAEALCLDLRFDLVPG